MLEWIQEKTGIYGFGFNPQSVAGLLLPIMFVVFVGAIGGLAIWLSSR